MTGVLDLVHTFDKGIQIESYVIVNRSNVSLISFLLMVVSNIRDRSIH